MLHMLSSNAGVGGGVSGAGHIRLGLVLHGGHWRPGQGWMDHLTCNGIAKE